MFSVHCRRHVSMQTISFQLNGINTQGENIADNGGLKEAYKAYVQWAARNGGRTEPKLPGVDLTPRQMFWISAANSWCAKYRPEALRLRVLAGQHSPGFLRVLGPMSNLREFSADYGCPTGTKMNPVNKCEVW